MLVLIVVLLVVGPDLGAYVQAFGRCGCPGGAGGAGDGVTVKRGGMYEIIRKVKGHPFPESFEA